MYRGWVASALIIGLLVGATVCIAPVMSGPAWLSSRCAMALGLTALAGAIGLFMALGSIANYRCMVDRVRGMTLTDEVGDIQPAGGYGSLADGINTLTRRLTETARNARRRAMEMDIQLKVATAERQHARAILHSISDAVVVTDSFDELVLANDAAAKMLQFDLASANRKPVSKILRDAKIVELIRDVRQSGSASTRRVVEHTLKTEEGERSFKLTLSAVADAADQPAGVVTVLYDVTREKEVAQMKSDFVSNVSHELRTPLSSIKAYVEMLVDGEANDEQTRREFYDIIQNESNRLGRLIDNILNISRIESGLVKVNKQLLSPAVVVKEALEVIAPQAKSKHIRLEEKISPVFYQTLADKDMLYQAVLNLMSNAVKYTPEGGAVTVEASVDEAGRKVVTKISDTGVGIPPKDLPYVFDKFYRVNANNHMAKGTGLGLSLVRHIVENVHHGRMLVESQPGKGSTFGFELAMA